MCAGDDAVQDPTRHRRMYALKSGDFLVGFARSAFEVWRAPRAAFWCRLSACALQAGRTPVHACMYGSMHACNMHVCMRAHACVYARTFMCMHVRPDSGSLPPPQPSHLHLLRHPDWHIHGPVIDSRSGPLLNRTHCHLPRDLANGEKVSPWLLSIKYPSVKHPCVLSHRLRVLSGASGWRGEIHWIVTCCFLLVSEGVSSAAAKGVWWCRGRRA